MRHYPWQTGYNFRLRDATRSHEDCGLGTRDPSTPLSDDAARLDATFINDLVGLVRGTLAAFSVAADPGDDTAIARAISAAIAQALQTRRIRQFSGNRSLEDSEIVGAGD